MPAKNGPQEHWRGLQEGSCAGFLQQMSAKNGPQEQQRGLQEGSCTGFLQQMSAKNGPQEQRRDVQEGSCTGFLQQMSAKNWAAGTMAWFAGRFLHWIPAANVRKKMGRRNPHPVWGFKNIEGSGVGWLRVALYAGLLCKRGVHGGTQKGQNGNLGQVELENGWPVCF